MMKGLVLVLAFAPFSAHADIATTKTRSVTVLADGIYEIRHGDAPDGFRQGMWATCSRADAARLTRAWHALSVS